MKTYHAAPAPTIEWNFNFPPEHLKAAKLQLLTIGGIAVQGQWCGQPGQYFVAWSPLLAYDKDKFNATIQAYNESKGLKTQNSIS